MTTKQTIISELKLEFPTLRIGNDDDGYINLSDEEYETTISEWADARLAKLSAQAEATAKAAQRRAILDHLKITEEEARILLGGN
jgi:hypothetical protein